jgi:hypothetical protein
MPKAFQRFWLQLTADKRKFSVLCAGVAVAMLFWARLIIVAKNPRVVMAEEAPADPAADVTDAPATDKSMLPPLPIALEERPNRDPFAINARYFPKPVEVPTITPEQGKSPAQPAENQQQAALRRVAFLQDLVDRMDLEAVMTNPPLAVINGSTYRQGDWIAVTGDQQIRFKLVEVNDRFVILECEDKKFELKMTRLGG